MVKCFRTIAGEEILAEIVEENENCIIIKNPIAMVMTPTRELAGVPWLPLAATTQNYTIQRNHILIIYTPNHEVIGNYRQQTGGIITAPANALSQIQGKPHR